MGKEKNYTEQLMELYQTYTGKELELALEVTTRSIQNYLKSENPTTPGKEVIAAIREAFANHQNGLPLKKANPDQSDQDYKEKYFHLLEEYNSNSSEVKEQLAVMAKVQKAEMELILSLISQNLNGRNKSSEILKRYALEGIFHNLGK